MCDRCYLGGAVPIQRIELEVDTMRPTATDIAHKHLLRYCVLLKPEVRVLGNKSRLWACGTLNASQYTLAPASK